MKNTPGYNAFNVFAVAAGFTVAFDSLPPEQQAGWDAAAKSGGFAASIGDTVTDHRGITGVVASTSNARLDRRGYWLQCLDHHGLPYDHFVDERDVAAIVPAAQ